MEIDFGLIGIIFVAIVVGIILLTGIKIIRPTHRGAIETLGKFSGFRKSGITYVLPFVQKLYAVNITEQLVDVQEQQTITGDDLNCTVDAQVYYKVGEDEQSLKNALYKVNSYDRQIVQLARTTLRNVIGTKSFRDVNSKRNELNTDIFNIMETQTKDWGINIVRVELKEIEPPAEVQTTMNTIIQAQNTKMAEKDFATAVETKADGEKRARIKEAEGLKESQVLEADGKAQAIERVAIAQADQIQKIAVAEKFKIEQEATAKKFEIENIAEADRIRVEKEATAEKFKIENVADAEAEAIKLVNESAEKYFKGNAVDLKKLEVTQSSLEQNSKVIMTEKGITPTLVINESKKAIIPTSKGTGAS
jgi:regulator of protease activity HflC (stomatin/prohibitin superfamily)